MPDDFRDPNAPAPTNTIRDWLESVLGAFPGDPGFEVGPRRPYDQDPGFGLNPAQTVMGMRDQQILPPGLEFAPESLSGDEQKMLKIQAVAEFLNNIGVLLAGGNPETMPGTALRERHAEMRKAGEQNRMLRNQLRLQQLSFEQDLAKLEIGGDIQERNALAAEYRKKVAEIYKELGMKDAANLKARTQAALSIISVKARRRSLTDDEISAIFTSQSVPVNETTLAQGRAASAEAPIRAKEALGESMAQTRIAHENALNEAKSIGVENTLGDNRALTQEGASKIIGMFPELSDDPRTRSSIIAASRRALRESARSPRDVEMVAKLTKDLALIERALAVHEEKGAAAGMAALTAKGDLADYLAMTPSQLQELRASTQEAIDAYKDEDDLQQVIRRFVNQELAAGRPDPTDPDSPNHAELLAVIDNFYVRRDAQR